MASTSINRHERISHFYAFNNRNAQGDLVNDKKRTLLQELEFESYKDLLQWLCREFATQELDWRKLDAGSPYPIAVINVFRFLEEKTRLNLSFAFTKYWKRYKALHRKMIFKNFVRLFGKPEFHNNDREYELYKYRLFIGSIRDRGLM